LFLRVQYPPSYVVSYYLGTIEKFKKGKANIWIKQNPIVSIEEIIEKGDIVSIIINYMEKYGWQNVQGSSWYEGQLDKYIPYKIKKYVSDHKRKKRKSLKWN